MPSAWRSWWLTGGTQYVAAVHAVPSRAACVHSRPSYSMELNQLGPPSPHATAWAACGAAAAGGAQQHRQRLAGHTKCWVAADYIGACMWYRAGAALDLQTQKAVLTRILVMQPESLEDLQSKLAAIEAMVSASSTQHVSCISAAAYSNASRRHSSQTRYGTACKQSLPVCYRWPAVGWHACKRPCCYCK